jgi:hypothetical protein
MGVKQHTTRSDNVTERETKARLEIEELLDSLDELEDRELSELGDPELLDFEFEVR